MSNSETDPAIRVADALLDLIQIRQRCAGLIQQGGVPGDELLDTLQVAANELREAMREAVKADGPKLVTPE